ncbi:MAG: TIGR03617 family F420-dependent LLM class oxidoreductase [Myxococcales bacterium]|nr:TIGR03617 family F420-dependent LLM class oxidoreductase [Myxococcales bacterium]
MFEVYGGMSERMPLSQVADHARRIEALGYDGLNVPEAVHDGLLTAHAALAATENLKVATSVLVVFPRSPMSVAVATWDLQEVSGGRFELGLGPQVRGNIVKRYSTPWTAPAPRMREYVGSLRAIFDSWQNGAELNFSGEHYQFTRMQPFFNPGPLDCGPPPIFLGAVGPNMLALVGEVADGMVTHPTNTAPRYLREVIVPSLERGAKRVGRNADEVRLMASPPTATGSDANAVAKAREEQREMLTFLFSTPSYWQSLELFGLREKGETLNQLTREGRWKDMAGVVDDAMLDTFVPAGSYDEIADILIEGYGGLVKSITFPLPADPKHDAAAKRVIRKLQGRG